MMVGENVATHDPIRVLWLVKGLGPGGMERLLVHHANVADRDRFEYHAAYLVDRPDSVVGELHEAGVNCTRLGGSAADPRWVRELVGLVRRHRIDVVHAHSPQPAAMARPALRLLRGGPRLVYTEHNTWDCYSAPTRVLNAVTYPVDQHTFAVSQDAKDSVPARLRPRVEVLTHGIDLEALRTCPADRDRTRAMLGIGADQAVVLNVAHLRTEKGHEVLLGAAQRLAQRDAKAVILAVGHGPRHDELVALADRLGVADRVRFLGFRDDVPDLLAAADVFCLSSHQEGLPVAFMEACALGLPSVVTAVGGLVDHVVTDRTGVLVPPGDPDAVAEALVRLVDDAELRRDLGGAAAAHAEVFDARVAVRRQEAVYASLCGRLDHGSGAR